MRRLFSSFAVMGGPHSYANVLATTRFHDENPKLFGAIVAALKEAEATIAADPRGAIAGWIAATGSKLPLEVAARVLNEPGTNWSLTPQNVMTFADFMARAGMIASAPASWRDLYFPEAVADRPGG
jgi:NitT/TauT family transport system substrate-binding protein